MAALRRQVGQLLIAGLEGLQLSPLEKAWLKIVEPAGVILFRRNIEAVEQTYGLLADVGSLSKRPLLRCVDLEGGLVDRLRDVIAPMPSFAAVAASGKKAMYLKHGNLIGREAKLLGLNTVFAPVLDLALTESHQVMRTRTYFTGPSDVTSYANSFLAGLKTSRIVGCGKHFPGLGGGALDSHHATPVIDRDWKTLWENDLLPYRKLKSRLPMVMVSHASYPATADSNPASISRHWITDVLIKRIGYRGLIVSDDMEMGGVLTQLSIEEAAVEAVAAGIHLLEICKDPSLVLRAYEALLVEAEKSSAFRRIVKAASQRVNRARRSLDASPMTRLPSVSQIERLRKDVIEFRVTLPEPQVAS